MWFVQAVGWACLESGGIFRAARFLQAVGWACLESGGIFRAARFLQAGMVVTCFESPDPLGVSFAGGVRERPNRHAWKACDLHGSVGSNPTSSAAQNVTVPGTVTFCAAEEVGFEPTDP